MHDLGSGSSKKLQLDDRLYSNFNKVMFSLQIFLNFGTVGLSLLFGN